MIATLLLLIAVALGLFRVAFGYPRPAERLELLRRSEFAFVAAAAEAMFPRGGAIEPSGIDARIAPYVDGYVARVPGTTRHLMRLLFFLLEHATLVFPAPGPRGWRRFSSLGPEQRVAALDGWRTSRLFARRLVFTSLRAILTMGYFGDPAVLRALGFAPLAIRSPLHEADLLYPRVGQPPQSIHWTRADLTPPSDGTPLDPRGPLDPGFAESAR